MDPRDSRPSRPQPTRPSPTKPLPGSEMRFLEEVLWVVLIGVPLGFALGILGVIVREMISRAVHWF